MRMNLELSKDMGVNIERIMYYVNEPEIERSYGSEPPG